MTRKQTDLGELAKAAESMGDKQPSKTIGEFVENATKPEDPIAKAEASRQADDLQAKLKATYEAQQAKVAQTSSGGAEVQQKTVDRPANAAGKTSAPPLSPLPVKRGRIFKPRKIVIHGPPGVGKSSLCADIPDVLFIDMDFGSEMIDVPRFIFRPNDEMRGHVPESLQDFGKAIRAIKANPSGIKALVVDGFTVLERLAMLHICQRDAAAEGKEKLHSLESYGYGKGRGMLLDQMREVLASLDGLITLGIGVVIVAHSEIVRMSNPKGADYDRYVIKALNHKDASVSSYTFGWADEVGFMHFDDTAGKIGGGKRGPIKGITGGNRILEFDHDAAWDAKARLPLPKSVKVGSANPWSFMQHALHRAYRMTPAEIRQEILDELTRIGDPELAVNVDKAVAGAGDSLDRLTAFMQELRRRPALQNDDHGQTTTEDPM